MASTRGGGDDDERTKLLADDDDDDGRATSTSGRRKPRGSTANALTSLFEPANSIAQIRPYEESSRSVLTRTSSRDNGSGRRGGKIVSWFLQRPSSSCCSTGSSCTKSDVTGTFVGSFTFLLYHVVFCLAQAATITRPHCSSSSSHSTTGFMAKTAALGVLIGSPLMVYNLQINALYPASDLFLAPFLAHLAEGVDDVLYKRGLHEDDRIFLTTFGVVCGAAFFLTGLLCVLASRIKLANVGNFLPGSVLAGFFGTIGILMWSLGFNVDTGQKVGHVVSLLLEAGTSGDGVDSWIDVVKPALIHHAPSFGIGVVMHVVGQAHPLLVILFVFGTVLSSYAILYATRTTLEQAQDAGWFYSAEDLTQRQQKDQLLNSTTFFPSLSSSYGPPAPFGVAVAAFRNDNEVLWEAVTNGVPTILALAFLYLIRCSLHAAAVRKNIPQVTRKPNLQSSSSPINPVHNDPSSGAEAASSLAGIREEEGRIDDTDKSQDKQKKKTKPPSIGEILEKGYGFTLLLASVSGGIAVAPSLAASITMFRLGAEKQAPQYGTCLLLLVFYLTDFRLVQYIPKAAFRYVPAECVC